MLPRYPMADSDGEHGYTTKTWYKHLVSEYTGLSFKEIGQLGYIEYLTYRRDAVITRANKTESGQEYLKNAWRMEQTEPDRPKLRQKYGGKEAEGNGEQ